MLGSSVDTLIMLLIIVLGIALGGIIVLIFIPVASKSKTGF